MYARVVPAVYILPVGAKIYIYMLRACESSIPFSSFPYSYRSGKKKTGNEVKGSRDREERNEWKLDRVSRIQRITLFRCTRLFRPLEKLCVAIQDGERSVALLLRWLRPAAARGRGSIASNGAVSRDRWPALSLRKTKALLCSID